MAELCGLKPDCWEKGCENALWGPPALGLGAALDPGL